jgi:TolA-binding protein
MRSVITVALACTLAGAALAEDEKADTNADELYAAAQNLLAAGKYLDAAEAYLNFVNTYPKESRADEASFRGGESYFRAGSVSPAYDRRTKYYERAVEIFTPLKNDARAHFRIGNILYLLGRPEEAAKWLKTLVGRRRLSPSLAGAGEYFLARSLLALGRKEEARKTLARATKRVTGVSSAYVLLALGDLEASEYRAQRAKERFDAALAAYRSALERTTKGRLAPETLFRIGELLRWAGEHADALKHYTRAVDQYPASPVKPYALLGAAYAALGVKKAEEARAHAVAARTGNGDRWLVDEARYVEGTSLVSLRKFAEAADALAPFLEAAPGDLRSRALHRLAWSAVAGERHDLARKAVTELLNVDLPDALRAEVSYLAAEVALISGNASNAIALYKKAVSGSGPTATLARYRLASALWSSGDARAAAAAFDSFVEKHANHALAPNARALAARSYLAAGEGELAAARFEAARDDKRNTQQSHELLWGASLAAYMRGNFEKMADLDRQILRNHGTSDRAADAAYWLAWTHLEKSDWSRAASLFKDAAGRAKQRLDLAASALIESAAALERAGDRAGALATTLELLGRKELAERTPPEVALWAAQALDEQGRKDEAQKILDATLQRAGKGRARARVLYALGQIALQSGDTKTALSRFDAALRSKPTAELATACRIGRGKCLAAAGKLSQAEVIFENVASQSAGWGHAAAYVELGQLRLTWAGRNKGERRTALASKAAEDFMLVALLYEPEGPGEGARLCARALLGAAQAYLFLDKHTPALDRVEQLLAHPLYGSLAEAKEARKLLQQIRLPTVLEEKRP